MGDEFDFVTHLDRLEVDVSHAQDADLGRVEHGREAFDAKRAQIGDREGAAGQFVGRDAAFDASDGKSFGLGRQVTERKRIGVTHSRHHQPAGRVHSDAQMDVAVLVEHVAFKERIQAGILGQRPRHGQQYQIVDGHALQTQRFGAGLEPLAIGQIWPVHRPRR